MSSAVIAMKFLLLICLAVAIRGFVLFQESEFEEDNPEYGNLPYLSWDDELEESEFEEDNLEYGNLPYGDIYIVSGDDELEYSPLNSIVDPDRIWTDNTIYYVIDSAANYTADQITDIENGIQDLVNSTRVNGQLCVNILPRTNEANYTFVTKDGGCSSYLGMIGGAQTVSLVDSCVARHGTIMHEFLHAFGFHHEHMRADRDTYVTINWTNIEPGTRTNFVKLEENVTIDHLGTEYDYGSVMHYHNKSFSIDDNYLTVIPTNPDAEIGQRTHVSQNDIERVQIYHGCLAAADSKYFKYLAGQEKRYGFRSPPL